MRGDAFSSQLICNSGEREPRRYALHDIQIEKSKVPQFSALVKHRKLVWQANLSLC